MIVQNVRIFVTDCDGEEVEVTNYLYWFEENYCGTVKDAIKRHNLRVEIDDELPEVAEKQE